MGPPSPALSATPLASLTVLNSSIPCHVVHADVRDTHDGPSAGVRARKSDELVCHQVGSLCCGIHALHGKVCGCAGSGCVPDNMRVK